MPRRDPRTALRSTSSVYTGRAASSRWKFDFTSWNNLFNEIIKNLQYNSPERKFVFNKLATEARFHLIDTYRYDIPQEQQYNIEASGEWGRSIQFDAQQTEDSYRITLISRGLQYSDYLSVGGQPRQVNIQDILEWMDEKDFSIYGSEDPDDDRLSDSAQRRKVAGAIVKKIASEGSHNPPYRIFDRAFNPVYPWGRMFQDKFLGIAEEIQRDILDFRGGRV